MFEVSFVIDVFRVGSSSEGTSDFTEVNLEALLDNGSFRVGSEFSN
jgi:hypothetical protein